VQETWQEFDWQKFDFPLIQKVANLITPDLVSIQPLNPKKMHSVKVNRLDLLEKVKKNRTGHRDLFLKAQEGYRLEMIAELEKRLEEARNGKKIIRWMGLPEPADHTDDYDTVIAMLEMSVDVTLDIDQSLFQQYVLDKWSWKVQSDTLNIRYANSPRLTIT
jgi:hypothetical protein